MQGRALARPRGRPYGTSRRGRKVRGGPWPARLSVGGHGPARRPYRDGASRLRGHARAGALGELGADDLRVAPETLRLQADFAEEGGNPQLAENLRRGAELVAFSDSELLAFYDRLRPGRATAAELDELAASLESRGAERCAALVREARAAYARRGLVS